MSKLYFNGEFLPMTGEGDTFEALVEEGGRIVFTGGLDEARAFAPVSYTHLARSIGCCSRRIAPTWRPSPSAASSANRR